MVKRKNPDVETIAYKFRIYPDQEQRIMLAKTFGCCRYLWNRMLSDRNTLYEVIGHVPNNTPADYKTLDECSWLAEIDSMALDSVKIDQNQAFEAFFNGKSGHPVFHSKRKKQSYRTNNVNNCIKVFDDCIKLPKISTCISMKMHRKIKQGGKLKSVTVTMGADRKYYVSLAYEYPIGTFVRQHRHEDDPKAVGLDMKLGSLYVDSNGHNCQMPQFFRLMQDRIAKEQRKLSHMKKGSNHYDSQQKKIAKLHAKVKHQREDFLRKEAYRLAHEYQVICIEDLDLAAMKKEYGKSVSDIGYSYFVQFLEEACRKTGSVVVKVSRYYPSSQLCHACGFQMPMPVHIRYYNCPVCGCRGDRDENAACNILNEGLRIYHETYKNTAA